MRKLLIVNCACLLLLGSCQLSSNVQDPKQANSPKVFIDQVFIQESHQGYRISEENADANDVRSIAIDKDASVWIATKEGVFAKKNNSENWQPMIIGEDRGPAYDIRVDESGKVWLACWNAVYSFDNEQLMKHEGPEAPIAQLLPTSQGIYAFGPKGIWMYRQGSWEKKNYNTARSFRDARLDEKSNVWLATDVGLYQLANDTFQLFQDTRQLISCYVKGIDFSNDGKLWAGGLGGVSIRDEHQMLKKIQPQDGLPSAQVKCIRRAPDGRMWVGTENGISRFWPDSAGYSVRHSSRWLVDNEVRDIAFDVEGNAWIATANGVSEIQRASMTLAQKADYFYEELIQKHVREPWIVGHAKMRIAGDTSSRAADDDDNDGEYTSMYLAMEAMRYATTGDTDAKERAKKAFDFLYKLREVAHPEGFIARTIIPADWTEMHDANQSYTDREVAEMMVRSPRYKIVEKRWRPSEDGKWLWKGDTSSDEMCGHMFGYYFYYQYVADQDEKQRVAEHVSKIMDHLLDNDFNLTDINGQPTKWGIWSPAILNHDPEWGPEKALNSLEMLSFLKFAYHISNNEKYQQAYLYLIEEEHYLENAQKIHDTNLAWFTYFDIYLSAYIYPALIKFEEDPILQQKYRAHLDQWFKRHRVHDSPMVNFMYNYLTGGSDELDASIAFLQDCPLDLIDWPIDNASREDLKVIRKPVLEELQMHTLRPPSEYRTIRWDKNPYEAQVGNPYELKEPVFWLLPYWMGRYLGLIKQHQTNHTSLSINNAQGMKN